MVCDPDGSMVSILITRGDRWQVAIAGNCQKMRVVICARVRSWSEVVNKAAWQHLWRLVLTHSDAS